MLASFFVMVLTGVLNITVKQMSRNFDFMLSWIQPMNIVLIVAIVVFAIFTIIKIIKAIK